MNVDQIATTAAAPAVHDFAERRRAIQDRLDALLAEEGEAVLDGRTFNRAPIDRLRAELESLDAAEGVAVRRADAALAADEATRRAVWSRQMLVAEAARLDAIDRAERAARDLCDALVEARAQAMEIHRLAVALKMPRALPALDHDARLSRRLSHVLKPVCTAGLRFGQLTFREALAQEHGPWRDAEAAMMMHFLPRNEDTSNASN